MAEVDVRSVKLENKVKKRERFKSDPDHVIRKRLPPRLPRRINDIYVTNKTNHQVSRCEKLLDSGESELVIHGLGAAVAKAVNLALQLQDKYQGVVGLSVNTSTVDIVVSSSSSWGLKLFSVTAQTGLKTRSTYTQTQNEIENYSGSFVRPRADNRPSRVRHPDPPQLVRAHPRVSVCTSRRRQVTLVMFFTVRELVQWLGLTVFEIWVNLVAVTFFTAALAVKVETGWGSWWLVFAPLFAGDALNAYFCTIVFIRMHLEGMYKVALMRGVWSLSFLLLLFVFKFLLCKKLSGQSGLVYSEVMSPIFILLQLILIRACQLH
uniref:DNA/RNA-binding protein Alba-like domain-containing protein n=1 Tax=Timema cristinae TaxID=61476 RepID=A0A7R9DAR9_TIMCR|nr:unnamed protein product [Timema cristinae]